VSLAFRCGVCDGEPIWRIERYGDAVVSWACAPHLSEECDRLQRDFEATQLVVTLCSKLREWVEISVALRQIARENA
jgi:hypothetical protein